MSLSARISPEECGGLGLNGNSSFQNRFQMALNPHYDFEDVSNLNEIKKVESYLVATDSDSYTKGGGDIIESPWGENQSLDADVFSSGYIYSLSSEKIINPEALEYLDKSPAEYCQKRLMVRPGNMLSLQRHQGRQEHWKVRFGVLTVILSGREYTLSEGQELFVPKGAAHSMTNMSDEPVEIIEFQTGVTREKDNIRLVDFSGRPIYPLTNELEFKSALLYANLQKRVSDKFGLNKLPNKSLLSA